MTTNAVGLATLAQPTTQRCPQCQGRGYKVVYIQESDGSEWPIARDCDCKRREETRRG